MRYTTVIKPIMLSLVLGLTPAYATPKAAPVSYMLQSDAPGFELGPIEVEEGEQYFNAIVRFTGPEGIEATAPAREDII